MIDIIGHFFILYPVLTFVRSSNRFIRSSLTKFIISFFLLVSAAFLTNFYLMDVSIVEITDDSRKENLYEVLDMTPQDL